MTWPQDILDNAITEALRGQPVVVTAANVAEARALYHALYRRRRAREAAVDMRIDGAGVHITRSAPPPAPTITKE